MISLYTALKLLGILNKDDELVCLRRAGDEPAFMPMKIFSVRNIKEKYDMRKTKVVSIRPYFCCEEYEAMLLTIKEDINDKK